MPTLTLIALGPCLAGLLALIAGAELVTRGGSALAARLNVPPILIGLTIVAVGTSMPELAVGIDAALQGNGALAVGNIAGTNTVNLLLILGLSALIRPLALHRRSLRLDLPTMVVAALALLLLAMDGRLSRADGAILIAMGVLYTGAILWTAGQESRAVRTQFQKEYAPPENGRTDGQSALHSGAALILGIAVIVVAADWFVDGAVALARLWGVSDAFIGLTVVAIGTSSPELVTTLVSTVRGEREIAIGNLLGSSVYNIVFILGATCVVPAGGLPVDPALMRVDIPVMALVALVCIPVFLSARRVSRTEGALFVGAYGVYLGYLLLTRM
ncbi:calcium/sodium antiporter [Siccirubricoccus phaeus]|uniref:calcium/sodium antiporter n=1 Tax=Siccirubricoccus phaeus TaxID=2595053 RepID=UPI001A9CA211|nr:calcium/sodium antiporter [Siccirubricoccus phaeus]